MMSGMGISVRRSLLGLAMVLFLQPALAGDDRVSTVKPFEEGDIFIAATVMDVPDDDHAGTGRILQYDADLNLKGVIWVEGTTHKIGGLNFGPDGTLWGFAQLTPAVIEFDPSGKQKPVRKFSDRTLSSVNFGADGALYFGEHLKGTKTESDFVTTKFKLLPGMDRIGDGHIFKYSADGELLEEFATDSHGGMEGYLAVTSTVLTDNDTRMIYLSETGNRVMQYDLKNKKQLPDLAVFEDDPNVFMVITMAQTTDGTLLITTGASVLMMDPNDGSILGSQELDGGGWAAITPTIDGEHALVGNFFDGAIVKMRLSDGEIVASGSIEEEESLSGIAQYPG